MILLSSPHLSGMEQKYIDAALQANELAFGENLKEFGKTLCQYSGVKSGALLSSGTAAIHLALIVLGVKPGDEVLTSTFTFSATVNPIIYQGATPIFIESEPSTWNMSPEFLEQAIKIGIQRGKKPKAIMPVHLYGMPANMEAIVQIAKAYQIPIIEDAAEALGAKYKGQSAGTFGDIGVYSFNGNKIITTSGGGALISDNEDYVKNARFLATQARDKAHHYQHTNIGYNYRMSNISASIGRGQMEVLDQWVALRRVNFDNYRKRLSHFPLQFLEEPGQHYFSNRWLTTILTDSFEIREKIRLALENENIESRPLWKPMHLQPIFKDYPYYGNRLSEELFEKGLCLPSGSNMTPDQQELVIETIISCFA